ncbi:MAG: hypothetical protein QOE38_206 [Thermoleophilaceae bacterium]|nr:hypothetical protein [Thermoleophilaceae bacterium]
MPSTRASGSGCDTDRPGGVVELVRKGAADLAVIGTLASDAPGLTSEVVAEEDLCVACAPDDALAGSSEIGFADLRGRGLILAEPDSPLRHAVAAACADAGFSPVPLFEMSDPWTVRFLTATGLGLSVVPRSWLELPGPPIAHVELTGAVPRHRVSLLTPAAGATPAAALLREHLRRRLTAPPPASASAGPDQREHGLAAVEHHERGHRHHAVAGRELLEHRAHHAAGPAPGGREVDHDRPVGLEHFGGEVSIGN